MTHEGLITNIKRFYNIVKDVQFEKKKNVLKVVYRVRLETDYFFLIPVVAYRPLDSKF